MFIALSYLYLRTKSRCTARFFSMKVKHLKKVFGDLVIFGLLIQIEFCSHGGDPYSLLKLIRDIFHIEPLAIMVEDWNGLTMLTMYLISYHEEVWTFGSSLSSIRHIILSSLPISRFSRMQKLHQVDFKWRRCFKNVHAQGNEYIDLLHFGSLMVGGPPMRENMLWQIGVD